MVHTNIFACLVARETHTHTHTHGDGGLSGYHRPFERGEQGKGGKKSLANMRLIHLPPPLSIFSFRLRSHGSAKTSLSPDLHSVVVRQENAVLLGRRRRWHLSTGHD